MAELSTIDRGSTNSVAAEAKQLRDLLARVGLGAGEEIEHLEARFLAAMGLLLQALFQLAYGLRNGWDFTIHAGWSSHMSLDEEDSTSMHNLQTDFI